jgi:hypothetical protein
MDLRCLACGNDRSDLLDVEESPSGALVYLWCRVCSKASILTIPRTCGVCQGVGGHRDGCQEDRPYAV